MARRVAPVASSSIIAQDLEGLAEDHGEPTTFVPTDPAVLARLREKLPEVFIAYWQRYGFSVFANGFFQLVNPEPYRAALSAWIKDTELASRDRYHVIMKTAFGHLLIWGETCGNDITLWLIGGYMRIRKDNNAQDITKGQANKWAESLLYGISQRHHDAKDAKGPMFARALKQLGPLGLDQVYGLVPTPAIGGDIALDNLRIVSAPEHIAIAAALGDRAVLRRDDVVERLYGSGAVATVNRMMQPD